MPDDVQASGIPLRRCRSCGTLEPAGRVFCAACGGSDFEPFEADGAGSLISWTVVRRPAQAFRDLGEVPIAVVKLDAGPTLAGRWGGAPAPKLGMRVRLQRMVGDVALFAPSDPAGPI